MILGVDVREGSIFVVRVDDQGTVVGRATQDAATPAAAVRDPADFAAADVYP